MRSLLFLLLFFVGTTIGRPLSGASRPYLQLVLLSAPVILRTSNARPYTPLYHSVTVTVRSARTVCPNWSQRV